jgi:flagellar basal-body rod protein FlgB
MIKDAIFGKTLIPWMAKGMDAMAQRQKAIADNIANAQSPGYRRKVVAFEDKLGQELRTASQKRLQRTDPEHLSFKPNPEKCAPKMRLADDRLDGPGSEEIVVEREMSQMAETQLSYEAQVKLTRTQLEMLKMAIKGMR